MRILAHSIDGSVDFLVDDEAPIGEEFTQPEVTEEQIEEVSQDAEESSIPEEEVFQDEEQSEESNVEEEQLTPQADAATPRFTGNKYYTPTYGTEGFYTPWGVSPLDIGQEYFKTGIGAIGLIGVLLFAIPFGIGFLRQLVAKFQDSLK